MSNKKDYVKEVLITNQEIKAYCRELSQTIEQEYKGRNLTLVCILKGSVPFLAELAQHFTRDDIIFEYIKASSYAGATTETAGNVAIKSTTFDSLADQHVIVVEDIIDTGLTIQAVAQSLKEYGAASIKVATLLDKPERRVVDYEADFIGFKIPNHFVVGFGLDYNEKYRNLNEIVVLDPEKI